jgi:hypothetical protein
MSAKKTTKATKTSGSKNKATASKPAKTGKAAKTTKPEAAPAAEVEVAPTTEPEAVPAKPEVAATAEARTCTHCGNQEFDEDGDCAKCHEPAPKAKATTKRAAKKVATNGEPKAKKLSAIDAAAQVLAETKQPMNTREMIAAMTEKSLWTSPGGKTPHATLYSAILREINIKGTDARFAKTERGKFAANGKA